ncbi:MAG: LysE family translocator [Desulfobacteraceae bacterium]|nr:LysE family translocator [Desulfobacteraceae bacterium]
MTFISLTGLFAAIFILAASPGPGVFAIISTALSSGFKKSLYLISGMVLGDIIYLLFAVFGLSAAASIMGDFFIVIKISASAYLIWLGVKIIMTKPVLNKSGQADMDNTEKSKSFLTGLFITLSNPKVILFYCGFLPAFADLSELGIQDVTAMAVIVSLVLSIVLASYAYFASKASKFLTSRKAVVNLNRSSGGIMIFAGALIAVRS